MVAAFRKFQLIKAYEGVRHIFTFHHDSHTTTERPHLFVSAYVCVGEEGEGNG